MIPDELDQLTPAWFSEVLAADITAVEVLDAHSGTTGRARVRISTQADLPETLFVKLQPSSPEQREFLQMVGMGVAEARLYAQVGEDFPARLPRSYYSAYDEEDGSFVMVLEDLEASGCRFLAPEDDDVLDTASSLMDELAALHAPYWGQPLPWLRAPAGMRNNAQGAKTLENATATLQSALDQFAHDMPPVFRELGELYVDRFADISALYREGERTLVHGDTHIGNLFRDGSGRLGFFDWAVASKLPGMRDVAYFMTISFRSDLRRTDGEALVGRYLAGLADQGVTLDESTAMDQWRLLSVYAWMGCTSTAAMGSRWQPLELGLSSMRRATDAIADLDSLGLLRERLGAG